MANPNADGGLTFGKWLFMSQNDILGAYARNRGDQRQLRDLCIQLFIFHEDRLLILQPEGKEIDDQWTTPCSLTPFDPTKPKRIYDIAIGMVSQALEERTLVNMQFADLHAPNNYIGKQWSTEDAVNVRALHMNIILTVESSTLDKNCALEYPPKYTDLKWCTLHDARKLQLINLPLDRRSSIHLQRKQYRLDQDHLIANVTSEGDDSRENFQRMRLLFANAAQIKYTLQSVDAGEEIPYALVLRKAETGMVILMSVPEEVIRLVRPGPVSQEVVSFKPLAGRTMQVNRYSILGAMKGCRGLRLCQDVGVVALSKLLGEGGRLNLDWLIWNGEMKVVDIGGS